MCDELFDCGFDVHQLSRKQVEQMQINYVVDYLISNYDTHYENFLCLRNDPERLPLGIDKTQAFRFFETTSWRGDEAGALLSMGEFNDGGKGDGAYPYKTMYQQFCQGAGGRMVLLADSPKLINIITRACELAASGELERILRPFAEMAHAHGGRFSKPSVQDFLTAVKRRFMTIGAQYCELEQKVQAAQSNDRLSYCPDRVPVSPYTLVSCH